MASYTPLFDSLTKGTLCGKWPDIGLWPLVLSMADRYGVVDVTHQYIATVSGLELGEVVACMDRFCQPDPLSRSQDNDGRRLVCLEEHRNWGWRIVNHGKYAEKARLIHKNARDVESGKAAERKRAERAASADVPRCPPESPSQAQAQAQAQTEEKKGKARKRATPLDLSPLPPDLDPKTLEDFRGMRERMRAPLTDTAVSRLASELERCRDAGFPPTEAMGVAVEHGWKTVKLDWLQNRARKRKAESTTDHNRQALAEFLGGTH